MSVGDMRQIVQEADPEQGGSQHFQHLLNDLEQVRHAIFPPDTQHLLNLVVKDVNVVQTFDKIKSLGDRPAAKPEDQEVDQPEVPERKP